MTSCILWLFDQAAMCAVGAVIIAGALTYTGWAHSELLMPCLAEGLELMTGPKV